VIEARHAFEARFGVGCPPRPRFGAVRRRLSPHLDPTAGTGARRQERWHASRDGSHCRCGDAPCCEPCSRRLVVVPARGPPNRADLRPGGHPASEPSSIAGRPQSRPKPQSRAEPHRGPNLSAEPKLKPEPPNRSRAHRNRHRIPHPVQRRRGAAAAAASPGRTASPARTTTAPRQATPRPKARRGPHHDLKAHAARPHDRKRTAARPRPESRPRPHHERHRGRASSGALRRELHH